MKQILVLGGGAAGMVAAIAAAQQAGGRVHVVLVEANPRLGKKLLATGNGRCNLANADIRPEWYFTQNPDRMDRMLTQIRNQADPVKWLESHGLLCRTPDDAGRIYPYSNQAADVSELLHYWLQQAKVEVLCNAQVTTLRQQGNSYAVGLADGRTLVGQAVICAMGGYAGPQFGTDGFGIRLARELGLRTVETYPCLVPLQCEKSQVAGLAGVRVKGDATLYLGDKALRRESGEIQFTEQGISGIAVMQLSGLLCPKQKEKMEISLDLFPQMTADGLAAYLSWRAQRMAEASIPDFMTGLLHRKVGLAIYRASALGSDRRLAGQLTEEEWMQFATRCKDWRFAHLTPTGWKYAQTTCGGIALEELEETDFSVKGCPTLFMVGETVDCAGSCGGFNLYWAFGSGLLAGRTAANRVSQHTAQPQVRAKARKKKR